MAEVLESFSVRISTPNGVRIFHSFMATDNTRRGVWTRPVIRSAANKGHGLPIGPSVDLDSLALFALLSPEISVDGGATWVAATPVVKSGEGEDGEAWESVAGYALGVKVRLTSGKTGTRLGAGPGGRTEPKKAATKVEAPTSW